MAALAAFTAAVWFVGTVPMAGFAEATKVARRDDSSTYDARIDEQWTVMGRPNGGYLLAVLGRAAALGLDDVGHHHPLASSAHFLTAPAVGPATVTVERLRVGRTVSQVRARLYQDGVHCMEALLTMGAARPASRAVLGLRAASFTAGSVVMCPHPN